jgi:flagellar motor switch protein FliG
VVGRVAKMGKVDPEVIRTAEETLRKKVRAQGELVTQEMDGKAALTEILRHMDPAKEQAILEGLEPNTANEIRKKLYTIDVVFQVPDKELQRVLRDYADRDVALITKGTEDAARERILAAVSERRRDFIRLEAEGMGAVLKSEVDGAIEDFLAYIQLLEQKGELTIVRDREEFVE